MAKQKPTIPLPSQHYDHRARSVSHRGLGKQRERERGRQRGWGALGSVTHIHVHVPSQGCRPLTSQKLLEAVSWALLSLPCVTSLGSALPTLVRNLAHFLIPRPKK